MADNVDFTPGTGATGAADDIGGVMYPRVKIGLGADGTAVDAVAGAGVTGTGVQRVTVATDDGLHTKLGEVQASPTQNTVLDRLKSARPRFILATFSVLTRPANTTAYTANDSVSDNATAGSVTALVATVSDTNDDPISVERIRVTSTDTGVAGKTFRAYIFNSDPTASSGVGAGDNAAWSNKNAGYVGTLTGVFKTFSDGCVAILAPEDGSRILCSPATGAKTLWIQLQTLSDFTPSANSTTFTSRFEGFQGRA